jgi:hypothetical protein
VRSGFGDEAQGFGAVVSVVEEGLLNEVWQGGFTKAGCCLPGTLRHGDRAESDPPASLKPSLFLNPAA